MKLIGILLAAGNSSRFGRHKLSYALPGEEPIGLRSARRLRAEMDNCLAVVRNADAQFCEQLRKIGFSLVFQPKPQAGMGNSLALAIRSSAQADAWLIALADMPWIQPATLQQVISSMENGASLAAPFFDGQRGHPVGFSQHYRDELMALDGDQGASRIIRSHARQMCRIDVDDPGILRDVDRQQDLIRTAR